MTCATSSTISCDAVSCSLWTDVLSSIVDHVASYGWDSNRPSVDGRGVDGLVAMLRLRKVTGLAVASWKAGDLLLDADQEAELASVQAGLAAVALEIDSLTLRTLNELGADGLIVLKGIVHAHLDYPDASWREYGDVDLLVAPRRLREVELWFESLGFVRSFASFGRRWDDEFGKSITMSSGRLEVDLHRRLSQGLALGVDTGALFEHRISFLHAGVRLPALDPAARLVHAAIHAMGGSEAPPLTGLIDIARMASDPARLEAGIALAREWDVALTLAHGVRLAAERVGGIPPSGLAMLAGTRGSANERLRLRVLDRPGHRFREDLIVGFLSLRGVRQRTLFASSLVADHVMPERARRP